ncbi:hypothetical protein GCM10010420_01900 [Streptomyces glaucosporus]|uniref:Uncharacterized protein n=1 Tax=Streptomyces glaucosporus TaxID=284044 RepID=A0ABN3HNE9_9ACTN
MPAAPVASHVSPAWVPADDDRCSDCSGIGIAADVDGSLTGTVGTLVLCACSGGLELGRNAERLGICADCSGTGVEIDTDGSLTGTAGTPVLCCCVGGAA